MILGCHFANMKSCNFARGVLAVLCFGTNQIVPDEIHIDVFI